MPFDSFVLKACVEQIKTEIIGAKVNKVHQPDGSTVILRYRGQEGGGKLLLCAHPDRGRLHRSEDSKENPMKAPLFVMVLRKWLEGSRITDITVTPGERVAAIGFSGRNDLGDEIRLQLMVEIMGKHSNIILVGEDGNILDGIRRYSSNLSRYRQVLPGRPYLPPPPMEKADFLPADEDALAELLYEYSELTLSKALGKALKGVSPLLAKSIPLRAGLKADLPVEDMGAYEMQQIYRQLQEISTMPANGGKPCIRIKNGQMMDFYLFPVPEWEQDQICEFPDMNQAVDAYFMEQDRLQQLQQARHLLNKSLKQNQKRLEKKISLEERDMESCEAADAFRQAADLLAANLYFLEKGKEQVELPSFEDPDQLITIVMDPAKTPQENIQSYYKRYSKAKNARQQIMEHLENNRQELEYLLSIQQSAEDCETIQELELIRKEAAAAGFAKQPAPEKGKRKEKEGTPLPPRKFISADGFTILVGRNNRQNDRLSLKQAREDDLWLHTQKIPGSHTIIVSEGRSVPESTILEAAAYAAWYSKAREAGKVPVDCTAAGNLKKPNGAVPGYVTYTDQTTYYIEPREPQKTAE